VHIELDEEEVHILSKSATAGAPPTAAEAHSTADAPLTAEAPSPACASAKEEILIGNFKDISLEIDQRVRNLGLYPVPRFFLGSSLVQKIPNFVAARRPVTDDEWSQDLEGCSHNSGLGKASKKKQRS
jgi:hypothetical protein